MIKLSTCRSLVSLARSQSSRGTRVGELASLGVKVDSSPGLASHCLAVTTNDLSSSLLYRAFAHSAGAIPHNISHTELIEQSTKEFKRRSLTSKYLYAKIFQCDVEEVEDVIKKYPPFGSFDIDKVMDKNDICKSFGLPKDFLLKHPRILLHTSAHILQSRLERIQDRGVLNDLLDDGTLGFYLEKSDLYFEKSFEYLCANHDALEGCKNQSEYLQHRFKFSEEGTTKVLHRSAFKKGISNIRLKRLLDFVLVEAGLPVELLTARPNIFFNSSVEKLSYRYYFAKKVNPDISHLEMCKLWDMTNKEFEEYYTIQV